MHKERYLRFASRELDLSPEEAELNWERWETECGPEEIDERARKQLR